MDADRNCGFLDDEDSMRYGYKVAVEGRMDDCSMPVVMVILRTNLGMSSVGDERQPQIAEEEVDEA